MFDPDPLFNRIGKSIRGIVMWIPPELHQEFQLTYLLWRVVDIIEDYLAWSREERIAALRRMEHLMVNPSAAEAERVLAALPETHTAMDADSEALLFVLPEIVAAIGQLDFRFQQTIQDLAESRRMLPLNMRRPQIIHLVRQDLTIAREYVHALQTAAVPVGVVMTYAALVMRTERILNAIEQSGRGILVDHRRIAAMVNEDLQAAFANTQPLLTAK